MSHDEYSAEYLLLCSRTGMMNLETRVDWPSAAFGQLAASAGEMERSFGRLEGGVDQLKERFDRLEARFGRLERSLEARFDRLDEGLSRVEAGLDKILALLLGITTGQVGRRPAIEAGPDSAFEVVSFPDHSSPQDWNLPPLTSPAAIDALTPGQVDTYYKLYYPQGRASSATSKLSEIYRAIGITKL
ncbi:hypothetical protein BD779DRAFT_1789068 [Infundibulicybe gibba]|nr:hypothetical protein BD779DRAFT_1789068 [Infundibulicybe gibba]